MGVEGFRAAWDRVVRMVVKYAVEPNPWGRGTRSKSLRPGKVREGQGR